MGRVVGERGAFETSDSEAEFSLPRGMLRASDAGVEGGWRGGWTVIEGSR